MPSLKKIRCVTREEKLFKTRVRCFQHLSLSRAPSAPSTPTCAEHLTLARNSSFSPLVAQCTNTQHEDKEGHLRAHLHVLWTGQLFTTLVVQYTILSQTNFGKSDIDSLAN